MFGGKNYRNCLILQTRKECILVAMKEGCGSLENFNPDIDISPNNPLLWTVPKPRRLISAMLAAYKYNKMGIFNCIIESG